MDKRPEKKNDSTAQRRDRMSEDRRKPDALSRGADADEKQKEELDEELNQALEESFPASDPVSIARTSKPGARRREPGDTR